MSRGWSAEGGELSQDHREILEAVESWLVDPRRERASRSSVRPTTEIHLDGDPGAFLARNGLG